MAIERTPGWKAACQSRLLTDLHAQQISIHTGGGGTVEGCTRLQSPRNLSIRHGQVQITHGGALPNGTKTFMEKSKATKLERNPDLAIGVDEAGQAVLSTDRSKPL